MKKDKQLLTEGKIRKKDLGPILYLNYAFLVIYTVMNLLSVLYVVSGIFDHPFGFLGILWTGLWIWIISIFYRKIFLNRKKRYLQGLGVEL